MLEKILYIIYIIEWKIFHRHVEFKNCKPACYDEWHYIEYQNILDNSEEYKNYWYYFIINYLKEKQSKEFD